MKLHMSEFSPSAKRLAQPLQFDKGAVVAPSPASKRELNNQPFDLWDLPRYYTQSNTFGLTTRTRVDLDECLDGHNTSEIMEDSRIWLGPITDPEADPIRDMYDVTNCFIWSSNREPMIKKRTNYDRKYTPPTGDSWRSIVKRQQFEFGAE